MACRGCHGATLQQEPRGWTAGEPDSSPSLPSQGPQAPASSLPTSDPPQPVPLLQLGGPNLRQVPWERVKERGGGWDHLAILLP